MNTLNQNSGSTISGSTTTTSGTTNNYIFLDDNGNLTQISKTSKSRDKYYIDPDISNSHCVIGIEDESAGMCSEGTALGLGNSSVIEYFYVATNKSRKILP
jgi:hypothetical protein